MLEPISENTIKRATLQFLKTYYKFRPRTSEQIAGYDVESERGIIVDGYISIPNGDESFSATFEATSIDTIDEIRYKRQPKALFWDSFAVGTLLTASIFAICYMFNYMTIREWGMLFIGLSILSILALLTTIYWNLVKDLQRYRYIYAIEQFKHYQANEQWVAIGEDVFPDFGNPYLKELKRQCVHHGFGLLRINSEQEAQLLITPSREELVKNRRSLANNNSFYNRVIGNRVNDAFRKLSRSSAFNNSYLRFRRSYFKQIILSLIGAGIIGGLFYKEILDADINYVNEKMYEKEMTDKATKIRPETDQYVIDHDQVAPFEEVDRHYVDAIETEHLYEKGGDISTIEMTDRRSSNMQFYVASDEEDFTSYDCARLFNFKGKKYLIQDASYEEASVAKRRVELLKSNGIDANLLWLGCFYQNNKEYVVYIDLLHHDIDSAKKTARQFRKAIRSKSIKEGKLAIRELTR